jgi:ADP-ribose pyrophosphatase YjhB (NUDIX family)
LQRHIVGGEQRRHWYCQHCDEPRHQHPVVVVTSFISCGDKLLWVQRAQPPQVEKWAIPGGFLERGETLAEGAARELREEAGVTIPAERLQLYMHGAITFINQVYVAFRATLDSEYCNPGPESLAAGFYDRHQCPWDEVAYPQVNDSIQRAYDDLDSGEFRVWQAEMTDLRYEFVPVSVLSTAPR